MNNTDVNTMKKVTDYDRGYDQGWNDAVEFRKDYRELTNRGRAGAPMMIIGSLFTFLSLVGTVIGVLGGEVIWINIAIASVVGLAIILFGHFVNKRENTAYVSRREAFEKKWPHASKKV